MALAETTAAESTDWRPSAMGCQHCGRPHPPGVTLCPVTERPLDQEGRCGGRIDRYRVIEWVGGGGFGTVYRAEHTVVRRVVALKLLELSRRVGEDLLNRFFGEARAAASVGDPHIVEVFDAGTTDDGLPFLAMEFVDGCSLAELMDRQTRLGVVRALHITIQVLEALGAAHRMGIVHRDVKPANIMLRGTRADGSSSADYVKLVDFGISKVAMGTGDGGRTQSGITLGTPGFSAPEQYLSARNVDARADLYSVSVVLYNILSGTVPFKAESYEQLVLRVCTEEPTPLDAAAPAVPRKLVDVVHRGLARDPNDRFQTAGDYIEALKTLLSEGDASAGVRRPVAESGARPVATRVAAQSRALERSTGLSNSWTALAVAMLTAAVVLLSAVAWWRTELVEPVAAPAVADRVSNSNPGRRDRSIAPIGPPEQSRSVVSPDLSALPQENAETPPPKRSRNAVPVRRRRLRNSLPRERSTVPSDLVPFDAP